MAVMVRRYCLRLTLAAIFAVAAFAGFAAVARADSIQAACNSSYCYWGYNYIFSGRLVYTPTSNFYSSSDNINSGGWVYLGFGGGGGSGCWTEVTVGYTVVHPSDFGCSSTGNTAFTQYYTGASSYLYFQAAYN
jgi:hypothetical protein